MREFKLKLTDEVHQTLKERAKKDCRSLQSYIELWMVHIATREYQPAPTPAICPEMKDKVLPVYNPKRKED